MALVAFDSWRQHRALMRDTASLATAPHEAAATATRDVTGGATRCVVLTADDMTGLPGLRQELASEGLDATLLGCADRYSMRHGAGNETQALLLWVTRGLAEQLGRLRELRRDAPTLPLLVACRGLRELDQVLALEMGADDVIDASWSAPVVAARLRARWRRPATGLPEPAASDQLSFGALRLHLRERRVLQDDQVVPLTEGEFEVLWLLACHAGSALSRRDILRRVRGLDDQPLDRSIDSRVYRIRAKLGDNEPTRHRIRTVRNRGYVFSPTAW